MDSAERYRRELEVLFQEMEAMARKENLNLKEMEDRERDRFYIRFWSGKAVLDLLASVPPEARAEINEACFRAWKVNQEKM